MPEQQRTERAREERDAEGEEGIQRLRRRIAAGEKYRADHHRYRETIDVEIVELDGSADEAGKGDTGGGGFHDEVTFQSSSTFRIGKDRHLSQVKR